MFRFQHNREFASQHTDRPPQELVPPACLRAIKKPTSLCYQLDDEHESAPTASML